MYLGEVTRRILLSLVQAPVGSPVTGKATSLFGAKSSEVLETMWGVDTQYMSEVESAWAEDDDDLPLFASFDVDKLDEKHREKLERVRQVVIRRFGYSGAEVGHWDAAVCFLLVMGGALH
jgi:hexokinase